MGRVLVIDDDHGVRDAFSMALEATRYEVVSASSGEDGLDLARMFEPDLILLDLKMPGMDGVETLRQLSRICPDTPVYIVTGFYGEFLEPLRSAQAEGLTLPANPSRSTKYVLSSMASLGRQGKESDVKHSRHASDRIHVKLYVTGTTPNAVRAREAMEALVASAPDTAIEFTVIDVLANPEAALADGVFATPTVIRAGQGIERRLVGDLSSVEKLQIGLFIDAAA